MNGRITTIRITALKEGSMDSLPLAPTPKKLKPPLGGLKHLECLLGLRRDQVLSTDAIFVSLDLEVASDRKTLHLSDNKPVITQLGFAYLDTRDIHSLSSSSDIRSLIRIRAFNVKELSLFKAAQLKSKKQCISTKSQRITQHDVPATIIRNLRIYDNSSKKPLLRSIILVGQSIKEDLKVIRFLNIDIFDIAPILTAIDIYLMARHILPPYSLDTCLQPGQNFTLARVLSALGCQLNRSTLHNAGNDAVYSLYAMLLLAIKQGIGCSTKLCIDEIRSLEILKWVVFRTLERGALNAPFNAQNPCYTSAATLGAGLREIAVLAQFLAKPAD